MSSPRIFYEDCASIVRCRRQEFTFARHVVVGRGDYSYGVGIVLSRHFFGDLSRHLLGDLEKERSPGYIKSTLCLSAPFFVADI